MGESLKRKKGSASGKTGNSKSSPKKESVIQRVVSYLKISNTPRMVFKPSNKRVGTVEYRVTLPLTYVSFKKLSDARTMKRLLASSNSKIDSVIIRTDTTEEGFVVSEREVR